jgi:hypothetical protein
MSESKPNLEGPSEPGSPIVNETFAVDHIVGGKAISWWAKWRRELGVQSFLTGYISSEDAPLWFYPPWFTSLWLYTGAGFLLKFARHFDIGFQWSNRKFEIEKKPLQSIGLVAGAWWRVVLGIRTRNAFVEIGYLNHAD